MRKITHLVLLFGCSLTGYTQALIQKEVNSKGQLTFARLRTDSVPKPMSQSKQVLKDLLKTTSYDEFISSGTKTDDLGYTHEYFSQYYKGIRVAYASYAVHGKDGLVRYLNGTFHKLGNIVITPKITEKAALDAALSFIGAKTYSWEVPAEEEWLKTNYNNSYYPKGELVIVQDRLKETYKFRLAWKFNVSAHSPVSSDLVYVDALNASVIERESRIFPIVHDLSQLSTTAKKSLPTDLEKSTIPSNATGTAATRYSGSKSIVTDSYSGGYRLFETRNGALIHTRNMYNQTNFSSVLEFSDIDNNWTSPEHANYFKDNAALDAHWASEMTLDFFKTTFNQNSWDNAYGSVMNYVHYPMSNDAAWVGAPYNHIQYGDGGPCGEPFTSLDIVAHEFSHGINNATARLAYQGESGAINESLSDMWAAYAEYTIAPGKQCWLMGEDVMCGSALRSMSNPSSLSYFIHNQDYSETASGNYPDTYNGTGYYTGNLDHGGVHENSSVSNFWFYLLVVGGSGTNDNGHCYAVDGIGFTDAGKIIYYAETIEIASPNEHSVSFSQFRTATINAATSLFGAASPQVVSVTNAWRAVGVGNAYAYTISGPSSICMEQQSFTVAQLPSGSTANWSVSPTNLFGIDSGTGATFLTGADNANSAGTGTISISVSGGCNNISITPITISIGGIQNYSGLTWTTNQTITNCTVNFTNMAIQGTASVQINIGSEFAATGTFEALTGTVISIE